MGAVAVVVVAHQFLAVEDDGGEAARRHRGRRFGRGRLKNRNCVRAFRTHPTPGLKVLSGLRLAENQKNRVRALRHARYNLLI